MLTLTTHSSRSVGGLRFAQPALAGSQSVGRAEDGARRFGKNRQVPTHGSSLVVGDNGAGFGPWSRLGVTQIVSFRAEFPMWRGGGGFASVAFLSAASGHSSSGSLCGPSRRLQSIARISRFSGQTPRLSVQLWSAMLPRICTPASPASNPSVKLSANGVAHWPSGAGASPHFAPAVQRATPLAPAYLER